MEDQETIPWMHLPRLVVFDLDYTLWYPYIDVLHGGPFTKTNDPTKVLDCRGHPLTLFPHVETILNLVKTKPQFQETQVAIASRTGEIAAAKECLKLLQVVITTEKSTRCTPLHELVDFVEIFPSCKLDHFRRLHRQSGIPYQEMLFFDDEERNIHDVQTLGVTCEYCPNGLSTTSWRHGLAAFQVSKNVAPRS
ncbi:hypothetical protein PsorP6_002980 [Peronosclerospora sorghi]|uniref:Uncharacterized protein n=1 Tax=Peronosclerospora sorghi TaxID=230839 RepID=A0ACC0VK84_9STRA|nr:hypothetical protein PsorP6_002980 [Peronosclerospora sorghi]